MGGTFSERGLRIGSRARCAFALSAVLALVALTAVTGPADAARARAAHRLVVSTQRSARYGTILVSGTTLYTLKGNGRPCGAACLRFWPALDLPAGVTHATAGPGVNGAKLGTVRRARGVLQVTYAGRPLYRFVGDRRPGQVTGNVTDAWGTWRDVVLARPTSSGSATTTPPSPTTTTTAPSNGGVSF